MKKDILNYATIDYGLALDFFKKCLQVPQIKK